MLSKEHIYVHNTVSKENLFYVSLFSVEPPTLVKVYLYSHGV